MSYCVYFDCKAGASGDMLVGACVGLLDTAPTGIARPVAEWERVISGILSLEEGGRFERKRVERRGVEATKIDFYVGETHADRHYRGASGHHHHAGRIEPANHGHHHHGDRVHHHSLHSHPQMDPAGQTKAAHSHEGHSADRASHHTAHRRLASIRGDLDGLRASGTVTESVWKRSDDIFLLLGEAEATVHGSTVEEIHFHEVGAFDALLDIVGFSLFGELLPRCDFIFSPVTTGRGHTTTAHGILDIPPPAVAEIIRRRNIPVTGLPFEGECLTPTGAAIIGACASGFADAQPAGTMIARGRGAGNKEFSDRANVVTATLLER